ncbi:MAG: MFS transporter [Caldimonas sp.]
MPLLLLGCAGFLSQFDVTALAVALPGIRTGLQLDTADGGWVVDSYSLAFAAALLPAGGLADGWGRRRVLLLGLAVFALASMACALSPSGIILCASRGVQGIGAALLTCATLALVAGLYPQREDRIWAFGWVGTVTGVAMIAGPAGGGAIASWFGWPAIFWINPPICAGLLVGCWLCIDEQERGTASRKGAAAVLLAVVGMTLAVWTLLEGPRRSWNSTLVLVPGAVAILMLLALAERLSRVSMTALVRPGFAWICGLAGLLSIGYWATLVYLPVALSQWFGVTPAMTGLLMLAATAPMLLLPSFGAKIARRRGLGTLFVIGMSVVAIGDLLLWQMAAKPHVLGTIVAMLISGIGCGLINAQMSGGFVAFATPAWASMASAAGITLRQVGYALGVALLGATENAVAPPLAGTFAVAALAAALGIPVACLLVHIGSNES